MKNILFKTLLVFTGFLCLKPTSAQTYEWVWISGSKTTDVSATATTPGSRDSQGYWQDASGNLWIFGGEDNSYNSYNDLWEYSRSSKNWTQIAANTSSSNTPSARYGVSCVTDKHGNFWLFGGSNHSDCYNDLWEYTSSSNTWNLISGSTTPNTGTVYTGKSATPGSRCYATAAIDASGNIWLFGGQNSYYDDYNELWEYSTTSGQWTFVSGAQNTTNSIGVYSGYTMTPGARFGHCLWIDASQNIWVYGGQGYDNNAADGAVFLNDLWEYSSGKWAWKGGSRTGDNQGVYGTVGSPSSANVPGSRYGASGMVDASNAFWLFGGTGYDASGNGGELNDLWTYSPSSSQWTWMGGSNAVDQSPVFGTQGIPASANQPGGLQNTSGWVDRLGNIWIMGGAQPAVDYNDLWEFGTATTLPLTVVSLQGISRAGNNYLTWQTTDEISTADYTIERSPDGITFEGIGNRTAVGSGGNAYSFSDADPPPGNNFYRLRVVYTNDDISYSTTCTINDNIVVANASVYPNPTTSGVLLKFTTGSLLNTLAKCYDAGGRLVQQKLITTQEQYLDLQRLSAGIYFLKLADGTMIGILKD